MLQDLRHLFRHERFLEHLPANNRADLHGDNRFLLDIDGDAEQSWEPKSEAVFLVVIILGKRIVSEFFNAIKEQTLIVVSSSPFMKA